jgi:hypothetical protein
MSAPTSASGGKSGNVTDGPNSTLVTHSGHRTVCYTRIMRVWARKHTWLPAQHCAMPLGRNQMGRRSIIGISALVVLGLAWLPGRAVSQHKSVKEQLLGAWSLVSIEFVRPDGSRSSTFGANPNGIAFFDATGHYIISVMRSDRAKYAINNFAQGTDEENKATAQGSITYFGTYSVSEGDQRLPFILRAARSQTGTEPIRSAYLQSRKTN